MSETQTKNPIENPVQLKLVVGSASEAVNMIKERFGEGAKVLSVKQSESGGIARLLQKPRLEVIVEVPRAAMEKKAGSESANTIATPRAEKPVPAQKKNLSMDTDGAAKESPGVSKMPKTAPAAPAPEAVKREVSKPEPTAPKSGLGYFADAMDEVKEDEKSEPFVEKSIPAAPLGSAANPVPRGAMENVKKVVAMLQSVGFDDAMIERIRYEIDFNSVGDQSTVELYGAICEWLQNRFPKSESQISGKRRAFIGSCGVGKTSALCKSLSADIFVKGLEPQVLKLDGEVPNPSYALETFCEIMGANFSRSWEEVAEHSLERPLYVDLPGVRFQSESSINSCKEILDELDVEERVIVVNAAYDSETIAEAMLCGERMGATAVVFTHIDEARKVGKLWRFMLNTKIRPLFFSHGPNQAGDYTLDLFSALLEKTFPHGRSLVRSASVRREPQYRKEVASV